MQVKFGTGVLETDDINSFDELMKFMDNMEGQQTSIVPKGSLPGKEYELFDTLLPKEMALMNLLCALKEKRAALQMKLFPPDVSKAYSQVRYLQQEKLFNLPSVDPESYEPYSKISSYFGFVHSYLDFLVYSRLGFNLALRIAYNGQVYILKDLRELHKTAF